MVVVDHRRLLVVVVIVLVILMATTVSSSQRNMTVRSLCVIVAVALSKMRNPTILYRLEKRKKLILHLIMLKKKVTSGRQESAKATQQIWREFSIETLTG